MTNGEELKVDNPANMHQFLVEVGIQEEHTCLVVGLGNWNVTPDALGPIAVENLLS